MNKKQLILPIVAAILFISGLFFMLFVRIMIVLFPFFVLIRIIFALFGLWLFYDFL